MADLVFVVPAAGLMVPDIDMGPGEMFPPEGRAVRRTSYIERRLMDGELIERPVPQAAPAAAAERGKRSKT